MGGGKVARIKGVTVGPIGVVAETIEEVS